MSIDTVQDVVAGIPHMTPRQAQTITSFMTEHDVHDVLELGFRYGVSTCYMGDSMRERDADWHITTIDLVGARDTDPNIEGLLDKLGLRDRVDVFYEPTSYTWRLMKMLEEDPNPRFDMCYLDGAHNWFVDGFAFFLVDRLLRPGGWIIFDDLYWTYDGSPNLSKTDAVRQMPAEEREAQQVKKVFDLLVKGHPAYGEFSTNEDWGFARKLPVADPLNIQIRRETVTEYVGPGEIAKQGYRKIRSLARKVVRRIRK
jgi:predicted O-methyltransferase YrrM